MAITGTSKLAQLVATATLALVGCKPSHTPPPPASDGHTATMTATGTATVSATAAANPSAAATSDTTALAAPAPSTTASSTSTSDSTALPTAPAGVLGAAAADRLATRGSGARVELLDGGAAPRALLHRTPATQPRTLHLRIERELRLGDAPAARLVASAAVELRPGAAELTVAARAIRLEEVSRQGDRPGAYDGPTTLADATFRFQVRPDGSVFETRYQPPADAAPLARAVYDSLFDATSASVGLLVPLDPVGVGARWRVTVRDAPPGAPETLRVEDVTLLARAGSRLELSTAAVTLAASDHFTCAQDAPCRVHRLDSRRASTLTVDLGHVGVERGRVKSDATVEYEMAPGVRRTDVEHAVTTWSPPAP